MVGVVCLSVRLCGPRCAAVCICRRYRPGFGLLMFDGEFSFFLTADSKIEPLSWERLRQVNVDNSRDLFTCLIRDAVPLQLNVDVAVVYLRLHCTSL